MQVRPLRDQRCIRIHDIVKEAAQKGLKPPLTIRIQDLLHTRVIDLNELFREAIKDENYAGRYRGVFPIKVNQLREVVEEIQDAGKPFHYGLECGSKPELMLALAMHKDPKALIICNGFKDDEFIRLALQGLRLGKEIYLVVEQISEVPRIIQISKLLGVIPRIGFRIKLSTMGEGKWASSSGEDAKFGLTSPEIIDAAKRLKRVGLTESLRLIHFHIGSQVPNIQTIKKATVEAARFYCEIKKMGFPMELMDVGGGLGIDYDGSRSNYESSMNYTMREYARDVVYNIKTVCQDAGIDVPDIVTESGRAVVAPHSILITEVCDRISKTAVPPKPASKGKNLNPVLRDLQAILDNEYGSSPLERYHDAQQKKEESNSLFSLGYIDLAERAQVDSLYWAICQQLCDQAKNDAYTPEELENLPQMMAEQYVCNFSIFQSLIDHWACKQLFPIAPLQRLDQSPDVDATLVDITCDSDGMIAKFVLNDGIKDTLPIHEIKKNEEYYLGVFFIGAYQETLGDLHNLFGDTNISTVKLEDNGKFKIVHEQIGDKISQVLSYVEYSSSEVLKIFSEKTNRFCRKNLISNSEKNQLLKNFKASIDGYTYFEN